MTGGLMVEEAPASARNLADVCATVIDAVDEFDRRTLPLGLYACEEYRAQTKPFPRYYQEWLLCLAPCLKQLGFAPSLPSKPGSSGVRDGLFWFDLPDGRGGTFNVVRASQVKVRKFGSVYRIDPHPRYEDRWDNLRLDRRITDLWKSSSLEEGQYTGIRLFLFIGFAREADPYAKELAELQATLEWEKHNVEYQTRTWADRQGRTFFVRICLWAAEIPDPTDVNNPPMEATA